MEERTTAVLLSRKGVTMQFSCRSATTKIGTGLLCIEFSVPMLFLLSVPMIWKCERSRVGPLEGATSEKASGVVSVWEPIVLLGNGYLLSPDHTYAAGTPYGGGFLGFKEKTTSNKHAGQINTLIQSVFISGGLSL